MIRKRKSGYEVHVYSPTHKKKLYCGMRKNLRGPGGAQELEREKIAEFRGTPPVTAMTCEQYAQRWFAKKHGPGTRRPSPTTEQVNRGALGLRKKGQVRPGSFIALFGGRPLDAITREEALDWAKDHPAGAKVVAAMFADAIDDDRCKENPFGNRRLPQKRGRRDIEPLTEAEIDRLADLALTAWQTYGRVVAAWIMFLAWTGCRPGEAAAARWGDLDVEHGLLTVPRIKGERQTDQVVLPGAAVQALGRMTAPVAQAPADADRLFLTAHGKPYTVGSYAYYFTPVRAAFVAQLDPARRKALQACKGALDVYALRHFTGSYMADAGANEHEISAQLGNSPEVCRRHYIHVYRDRVNERNAGFLSSRSNVVELGKRRKESA